MAEIETFVNQLMGLDADELTVWHMAVRAVVVYLSALLMIRIGEKRFMGKNTAFDVILGIIFGSVVSRAITGSSEFFPTLGAGLVLVLRHWLFSILSFRTEWFGTFVKGNNHVLIKDGDILWDAMQKSHISKKDLMSALRLQGSLMNVEDVKEAHLERNGSISVIKASSEPKVFNINIEDGVKTVQIRLE